MKVTHRPNTVIVSHSYFHDSSSGHNGETCPTSEPSVIHSPNPKLKGQSQDIVTGTNLRYIDDSTQASESNMDIQTAYETVQQPAASQTDNPTTIEISKYTTEINLQNEPSHSGGKNYNLHPNLNPNYSEIYRY